MTGPSSESLQHRQVGRSFEIEHPARLLRLVVLLESDLAECLRYLAPPVLVGKAVGPADERDHQVPVRRLVEEHLGVAGRDDLSTALARRVRDQAVDLTLAEDLQVRVGLVQQEDRAGVRIEIGQEEQGLLESATRGGEIESHPPFPVAHGDLATLRDVAGRLQLRAEEAVNLFDELPPVLRTVLADVVAEVAQHFGRAGFPDTNVDRPVVESGLGCRETRHRWQEGDRGRPCFARNGHPLGRPSLGQPQRPAVERLLVRIVELEPATPAPIPGHPVDGDFDPHVGGPLTAADIAHVADVELTPQEVGVRNGYRDEIPAVDRDAGALLGCRPPGTPFVPALEADVPESECLQGRGLPGVVGSDEDDRAAELDIDLSESLEIADGEPGQHRTAYVRAFLARRPARCHPASPREVYRFPPKDRQVANTQVPCHISRAASAPSAIATSTSLGDTQSPAVSTRRPSSRSASASSSHASAASATTTRSIPGMVVSPPV